MSKGDSAAIMSLTEQKKRDTPAADRLAGETKICDMVGVRECSEGLFPVELWRNSEGILVIRAYNECGNNCTDLDLWSLIDWLSFGSGKGMLDSDDICRTS
jgi:hypothetical protein